MPTTNLTCWKCGSNLPDVPLPVGRGEECPKCVSSVRVCRMCRFYDPDASNDCRETMSDVVSDKEAANTCDYFSPRTAKQERDEGEAEEAKSRLNAVFGGGDKAGSGGNLTEQAEAFRDKGENEAEEARRKLEAVFNKEIGGRED